MLNGEAVSETASSSLIKTDLSTSFSSTRATLLPSLSSTKANPSFPKATTSQTLFTFTMPVPSSSSSSADNSSDKTGVIVGGVIGGVAVLALISGILAWTWINHNRRNPQVDATSQTAWTGRTDLGEYALPEDNETHEVESSRPTEEQEFGPIAELEPTSFALQPEDSSSIDRYLSLHFSL